MTYLKSIAALFTLLSLIGLAGCEERTPTERAVDDIEDAAEDVGDEVEDAAEDASDAVEDAAEANPPR
jgi:hypothetical protein